MDYARIYKAFIRDRRTKEAALIASGAYCERHHITPRSLNGSNTNANVIRLTYRDHIFAHALLLKMHKEGEARWLMAASMSAVLNLRKGRQRDAEVAAIVSKKYRWARRAHGLSIRGKNHPNYSPEVRQVFHLDGTNAEGTRQELIEKTGLDFRAVYDLLNGVRDFADGWCSTENERECRAKSEKIRATCNIRNRDGFYHLDGRFVKRGDLEGCRKNGITRLIRSRAVKSGFYDGWGTDPAEVMARAKGEWRQPCLRKMRTNAFDLFEDEDLFDIDFLT